MSLPEPEILEFRDSEPRSTPDALKVLAARVIRKRDEASHLMTFATKVAIDGDDILVTWKASRDARALF